MSEINIAMPKCKQSLKLLEFVNHNEHNGIAKVIISKSMYSDIRGKYNLPEKPVPFNVLGYVTEVKGKKEYEIELL